MCLIFIPGRIFLHFKEVTEDPHLLTDLLLLTEQAEPLRTVLPSDLVKKAAAISTVCIHSNMQTLPSPQNSIMIYM